MDHSESRTTFQVVDRADRSQFEIHVDGEQVGLASYSLNGDVVTIPHVETFPEHRGNGYAERLMDGVIADLRITGRSLRPLCPFARSYVDERPDTRDVVTG
ncbi:MAG: GNAT family N-acetyltransferase [Actinomycetota bacterium]